MAKVVWPARLLALLAVLALGTVPSVAALRSAPVNEPSLTLAPVTALFLIFAVVTAFLFSFAVVTALAFSCFLPTLFLASWLAAMAVAPPRTRNTAIDDITFAYVSRLRSCFK
jgi:hypothetical protein